MSVLIVLLYEGGRPILFSTWPSHQPGVTKYWGIFLHGWNMNPCVAVDSPERQLLGFTHLKYDEALQLRDRIVIVA